MTARQNHKTTDTTGKNAAAFVLSKDPNKAMQEMMETIDALRGVYIRETEALEGADTQGFLALQDEKLETARKYQSGMEELLSRKDEMKNVNPILKKKLHHMNGDFSKLVTQNKKALEKMQRCVARLGGVLRNAARDAMKKERAYSYTETGHLENNDKKTVTAGTISETA